jgi:regulator of nonsense transcripts 2
MDIEFIVQDIFVLRPQWKLATTLEEASKAFFLAVAQDQKNAGVDKNADQSVDQDEVSSASSDDDMAEGDGDGDLEGDKDEDSNSDEDEDIEVRCSSCHCSW